MKIDNGLIYATACIIVYTVITAYKSIQAYRKKDKEAFKSWFPYFLLTFTGLAPIIIVSIVALLGLIGGISWLCVEYIPNKITKHFDNENI